MTGTNDLGGTAASVWVFNRGMRDAANVPVGLYDRDPVSGTVPLVSTQLDIPAGEWRVANLNLEWVVPGFYVGVDINHEAEDRDVGNNVLLVGEVPYRLYLPVILRSYR